MVHLAFFFFSKTLEFSPESGSGEWDEKKYLGTLSLDYDHSTGWKDTHSYADKVKVKWSRSVMSDS